MWDSEILYTQGDAYFAALIKAIDAALTSIEIETYIYEKGVLAERLSERLIAAVQRGVKVRLIVDGWGSPAFVHDYLPQLKKGGVKVRFYRMIPWILRRLPGDPKNFWRRMILRFRRINRGNHRKFCLIDHQELWVGSFNISDVHLKEVRGERAWKDAGVAVRGPEVKFAYRAFRRAFNRWTAFQLPARSPKLLLLNDSFIHKRRTRRQHLARLHQAKSRVWLATPYFVPVGRVMRLLLKKARSGVDVRLIVPRENDVWLIKWMSLPLLAHLAKHGVKVYVYAPVFSHQKLFIADDWISLGSTNINHRSYLHDLEMDVVLTLPENKNRIIEGYLRDQGLSEPFDEAHWRQLPWTQRKLSSVFLLAKYWA